MIQKITICLNAAIMMIIVQLQKEVNMIALTPVLRQIQGAGRTEPSV